MEPLNSIPAIIRRASIFVSILIMLAATVWLVILWPNIPEMVPTHFAADGSPSSFDSRMSVAAPLIMGWIVTVLFCVMERYPQMWNIPGAGNGFRVSVGKFGRGNNGAQATPGAIASMRSMMAVDRVVIALLLSIVTICSAKSVGLPGWAMISLVGIMAASSVFFSIQASVRNKR